MVSLMNAYEKHIKRKMKFPCQNYNQINSYNPTWIAQNLDCQTSLFKSEWSRLRACDSSGYAAIEQVCTQNASDTSPELIQKEAT